MSTSDNIGDLCMRVILESTLVVELKISRSILFSHQGGTSPPISLPLVASILGSLHVLYSRESGRDEWGDWVRGRVGSGDLEEGLELTGGAKGFRIWTTHR